MCWKIVLDFAISAIDKSVCPAVRRCDDACCVVAAVVMVVVVLDGRTTEQYYLYAPAAVVLAARTHARSLRDDVLSSVCVYAMVRFGVELR